MSDIDRLSFQEAELRVRRLAFTAFISYLSEIVPYPERRITPQSHLVDDLGFDAIAFNRLGLMVAERFEVGGISAESLRSESLTVEGFFEKCIIQVLDFEPDH